jgi:nucleoid-associated protein YgaU
MKKKILFTLLILSLFTVISCKSAPEPEEELVEEAVPEEVVEEPVVESGQSQQPVVKVEPEEPIVESVSQEELALARQALERAEMVDGSRFAPELMNEAYADMKKAEELAETDPEQARVLLAGVVLKGDQAFELGKSGIKKEANATLDSWEAKLQSIDADKYSPEPYAEVIQQFENTRKSIESEQLSQARKDMELSRIKSANLYKILDENIRWIKILERDTNNYLSDAEKEEAYLWADEEFNKASYLLSNGMVKFRKYDLENSEVELKEAKFRAKNALYLTRVMKKQADTDARLMQIQMELEDASTLTVQSEEGEILEAAPWSGSDYLIENPLMDAEGEEYESEDSELMDYDLSQIIEEEEEELEKSAGMSISGLLERAKELWQMAIEERNAGNYEKSKELLTQAEAYIKAYKANAVGRTYVVSYREVNTDCLWRIAEFQEIYNDPFLWPKIWQRNQKSIPNPDLIYPGQVLIIPPVE